MRALLVAVLALAVVVPTVAAAAPDAATPPPVLQISDIANRADLDLKRVAAVIENNGAMRSLLKTRKGKHRVFTFVGATWGNCKDQVVPCKVHPVLMLEVDKKGVIVDGYYFILEWADWSTVWRVTTKDVRLRAGLALRELGLESDGEPLKLAVDTILDDVYRGEQVLDADGIK